MEMNCFHNPDEENGYLSNWYLSEFSADGEKYYINGFDDKETLDIYNSIKD